jgi:hypothetical protein
MLEAPVLGIASDIGNFDKTDSAWGKAYSERTNFQQKKIIGLSFDPVSLMCGNCEEQHGFLQQAAGGGGEKSKIFVLADQGFPSGLVPEPGSDCVNVIRGESFSLFELVDLFVELTGGCRIPTGTIVLLSSLSHLADVGFQAYAEDVGKATNKILRIFRGGIMVFPGLIFPPGSLTDPVIIRSLSDLMSWSATVARAVEGGGSSWPMATLMLGSL